MNRSSLAVLTLASAAALTAAPAQAKVTRSSSAEKVAKAIVRDQSQLRGASWKKLPRSGSPAAVSSSPFVSFPRAGETFGLLSTGNATAIGRSNDSDSLSTNNRGNPYRGTRDTVILRVDITAPSNARCLSFNFRFLSEEYPEFVKSEFNDAFLAELDKSTWTAATGGPKIKAPDNFAKVRSNRLVSVNGAGDFAVTPGRARNTTYDAGTRRLRASTPITPGKHSVYFSIFDQGDHQYDSTVVIDRLVASNRTPCTSGASLD